MRQRWAGWVGENCGVGDAEQARQDGDIARTSWFDEVVRNGIVWWVVRYGLGRQNCGIPVSYWETDRPDSLELISAIGRPTQKIWIKIPVIVPERVRDSLATFDSSETTSPIKKYTKIP